MTHNALMEPKVEGEPFLYCHLCPDKRTFDGIPWFPQKLANMNHLDGATRRTWQASTHWGPDHWRRVRTEEEEEFYLNRRRMIEAKASTSFVCKPCAKAAAKGKFGDKAHTKAGCKGEHACDCQHREPNH
ncbi:hypothetical protein AB0F25_30645 [Streptomyces wedmorensis]|uniref:hypothetical protein n=1 Tax=Streptomyces wedmorensis TaxID=43759 RepID=UPI003435E014